MCRHAALALALAVGSLAAHGEARGQQTDAETPVASEPSTPEELRAHLDSLRPLVEEAREAVRVRMVRTQEERRRAAVVETRVDTLRVGRLTVLTPTDQSRVTEEIFAEVWQEHFAGLGHSPALEETLFVFQWTDEPATVHIDGEADGLVLDRWTRRARVDAAVRDLIARAMGKDLSPDGTPLGRWLSSNPFHVEPWERIYRRVATTPSRTTRECLAGDAAVCGVAMGLGTERTMNQLEAWYEPDERRALVAATIEVDSRRWGAERRRCLNEGTGCDALMLSYPFRDWAPLGGEVRRSLVTLALEEGGRGAWTRLFEDPGMTPTEALEHASGLPMTHLMSRWQDRLVANRPDISEDLIPRSGQTLLWTLFFAALGLRSTRWRLG